MMPLNMYSCATIIVCLFLVAPNVSSYAIDQTASSDAAALQVLNEFRTHLIAEGAILPCKEITVDNFDELEVLRFLPMIITYMKSDALSSMEQNAFEQIYGSIWELVVEESQRHRGHARNPILTALLASPELRQTQPENPPKLNNDIEHIVIPETIKAKAQTSVSQEAPSQRVLHKAATIVQRYYLRHAKQKSNSKRKTPQARRTQRLRSANVHTKQLSADSIRVTIELPRYKRSVAKAKQHTSSEDEEDAEMEAKILAAIQAQIGNPSLEEEDDEEEEEEVPVQLEEDSSEYLDDEADYMGILGDDDDDDDDEDDDDDDEDEEEDVANNEAAAVKRALLKANAHDYENPSFNELLLLAARHRAIQQQRLKQRQHLAYRKTQSNRHSSYEDY